MGSFTAHPGAGPSGGGGIVSQLLGKLSAAGVDISGGSSLTEEQKKALQASGVSVNKKGGVVSASRRADGIAQRGKTRGKMV